MNHFRINESRKNHKEINESCENHLHTHTHVKINVGKKKGILLKPSENKRIIKSGVKRINQVLKSQMNQVSTSWKKETT